MITGTEVLPFDERRDVAIPGDKDATINYCVNHFIKTATHAITARGRFCVALAGGSTPKAIFERLQPEQLDWSKVFLFWSDERTVKPDHPDSNYRMAMDAGFAQLPIPDNQIFRMVAEENIEANAQAYEKTILEHVPEGVFDLIMLGMGEDGHTASLFPETHALDANHVLVVSNLVPQKDTWRMTFTYACINQAHEIVIYVLGDGKAAMVDQVLNAGASLPIQKVGTPAQKALWILDQGAAAKLT
jgi:6-phosphogluconolactonase